MLFARHTLHAITALMVMALPIALAFDVGGIFAWDWWAMGAASCLLVIAAGLGESDWELPGGGRQGRDLLRHSLLQWSPLIFALGSCLLAALQVSQLPAGLVDWLSPGSSDVYRQWLPVALGEPAAGSFPVSVWPGETLQRVYRWLALSGLTLAAGLIFRNRHFAVVLLLGLAVAGITHGILGFYQQQTTPGIAWNFGRRLGAPFGAFVNRNNAGAMMNLGLAGAVGLLALVIRVKYPASLAPLGGRRPETPQPGVAASPAAPPAAPPAAAGNQSAPGIVKVQVKKLPTESQPQGRETPPAQRRPISETHRTPYPGTELPDPELPGTELPGTELSGTELPGTELPGTEFPAKKLPSPAYPSPPSPIQARPSQARPGPRPTPQAGPGHASPLGANSTHWASRLAGELLTDRLFLLAALAVLITVAAVVASGSRGALVGAVAGGLACLAAAVPARNLTRVGTVGVVVFLLVLISLEQLNISAESIDRFSESSQLGFENDGRFTHWPDGLRASGQHLPLGAGLGSYQFAYLPYQQTSGGGWAKNADNLWLEWWLEGGLAGAILLLISLTLGGLALRRLMASSDPIDQGLGTTGIFALVALGLSQLFDFGLTLSPNLALTLILAAGIAARAAAIGGPASPQNERKNSEIKNSEQPDGEKPSVAVQLRRAARWRHFATAVRWGAPLLLALALFAAVPLMADRAASEAETKRIRDYLSSGGDISLIWLDEAAESLQQLGLREPTNERVWITLGTIEVQRFRIKQALAMAAGSNLPLQQTYGATKLNELRAQVDWAAETRSVELLPEAEQHLVGAAEAARQALRACPLSDEARWQLVLLDFAVTDPHRTGQRLIQLSRLRNQTPQAQLEIAEAAITMGDWEVAERCWQRILQVSGSKFLRAVFEQIASSGHSLAVERILPDQRGVKLAAVDWLLKNQRPGLELSPQLRAEAEAILKLPITPWEQTLRKRLEQ